MDMANSRWGLSADLSPGAWEEHRPRRERAGLPLYEQTLRRIEAMAMASPLGHSEPFAPESELVARLGVSRGTLRRATEELARQGLLRIEPGRGTFVNDAERVRRRVWGDLVTVARPDSRFDLNLRRFIPDFAGRERCDERLLALPAYHDARTVFVAPDNSLEAFRAQVLRDRKQLVVPTYGLARGFVLVRGDGLAAEAVDLAATLDAMERFGRTLDLPALRALGRIDLVVTGAVAVTTAGVHIDAGHGYFAAEWRLLAECALVEPGSTPVVALVHGCQVLDADLEPGQTSAVVNLIVTPRRTITCAHVHPPAPGLDVADASCPPEEGIGPYVAQMAREHDHACRGTRRRVARRHEGPTAGVPQPPAAPEPEQGR